MKFLKVALVLAMALCLTASVYAETQSVKVSGDLTVRGIWRNAYEYRDSAPDSGPVTRTGTTADTMAPMPARSWWMSTTEVQIDADLTDNVSTCIRLLNERDWNVQTKAIVSGGTLNPNGLGLYTPQQDGFEVDLDLAYVTLKNFIYCPLTVTIGRQDLWFGKGFIVGSNAWYDNWNTRNQNVGGVAGTNAYRLSAPEYTAMTAFDSIKAVLDYDPWTISMVYSKIMENTIGDFDDIDLYGVNLGYKFECYKAEAEAYWFWKQDRSIDSWAPGTKQAGNNDVHTVGIRGSADPIDSVTLSGELAYQFGNYIGSHTQAALIPRSAWAFDVAAEYRGLMDRFCWKPKLGIEYIFYSGEETNANFNTNSGVYRGWDPMFRGKYDSAIREFVGQYYATYDFNGVVGNPTWQDASFTNQNQLIFSGSLQPMDSVTLKGNANLFWLNEPILLSTPPAPGVNNNLVKGYIGTEFDFQAIWDYTEDVSFGLLAAWFIPGADVYTNANSTAQDIVGTCKVSF